MEDRQLVIGGFYRHFKNKLYQVRCIAYHSETKEKMVVYQALYDDFSVYVRPYAMFMSEVDHEKYPDIAQKYRFEQVVLQKEEPFPKQETALDIQNLPLTEEEGTVNPYLLLFLDAESYTEKLNVLALCKDKLDDGLINAMAASMEIEVPDGSVEQRYASLRSCIRTYVKYEGTRLR